MQIFPGIHPPDNQRRNLVHDLGRYQCLDYQIKWGVYLVSLKPAGSKNIWADKITSSKDDWLCSHHFFQLIAWCRAMQTFYPFRLTNADIDLWTDIKTDLQLSMKSRLPVLTTSNVGWLSLMLLFFVDSTNRRESCCTCLHFVYISFPMRSHGNTGGIVLLLDCSLWNENVYNIL